MGPAESLAGCCHAVHQLGFEAGCAGRRRDVDEERQRERLPRPDSDPARETCPRAGTVNPLRISLLVDLKTSWLKMHLPDESGGGGAADQQSIGNLAGRRAGVGRDRCRPEPHGVRHGGVERRGVVPRDRPALGIPGAQAGTDIAGAAEAPRGGQRKGERPVAQFLRVHAAVARVQEVLEEAACNATPMSLLIKRALVGPGSRVYFTEQPPRG